MLRNLINVSGVAVDVGAVSAAATLETPVLEGSIVGYVAELIRDAGAAAAMVAKAAIRMAWVFMADAKWRSEPGGRLSLEQVAKDLKWLGVSRGVSRMRSWSEMNSSACNGGAGQGLLIFSRRSDTVSKDTAGLVQTRRRSGVVWPSIQ